MYLRLLPSRIREGLSTETNLFSTKSSLSYKIPSISMKDDLQLLLPKLLPRRYIRKSSDETSRKQSESIPKQYNATDEIISDYFPSMLVPTFEESITAKRPHDKPRIKWRKEIIQKITEGKCNCLIGWKLSRFARNDMEAMEILMLYREGKIKAIFTSDRIYYRHDARDFDDMRNEFNEAISYSEYLSEDIIEGNENIFDEGKSNGKFKWGYYREKNGKYIRCRENFDSIKEALHMMIRGATNLEVLAFLRGKKCRRVFKKIDENGMRRSPSFPTLNTVRSIRRETMYYGLLRQGSKTKNLCEISGYNFEPMISKDEYWAIQGEPTSKGKRQRRSHLSYEKEGKIKPLDGLGKCVCGENCMIDFGKGKLGKTYAYMRCVKKKKCRAYLEAKSQDPLRKIRYTRLRVVIDAMQKELEGRMLATDLNEKQFQECFQREAKEYLEEGVHAMKNRRKTLRREKGEIESCLADHIQNGMRFGKMEDVERAVYEKGREQMLRDIKLKEEEIASLEKHSVLQTFDYKRMVELLENGLQQWRNANPIDLDHFAKVIWSNLCVFDGSVKNFEWNPIIEKAFYPPKVFGGA